MTKILFVTDRKNLDSSIPGGVQLCTRELMQYFKLSGFEIIKYSLATTTSIEKKLKIKLGLEVYDRYDFDDHIAPLLEIVRAQNIKLVALNQLNLTPLVETLKAHVSNDIKFIGLSHGNESSDYLHDITESTTTFFNTWKLGKQLVMEKHFFTKLLNGIVVISEQEISINYWLGALNIMFLPRLLKPGFLNWLPVAKRIGFVGTLDHLPNFKGLSLVARQLSEQKFTGTLRLVGSPEVIGKQMEEKFPFVSFCGRLSEDELLREVATWSIFLNPVFWFSRGSSTKLAQAINWGIPIISTPAGRRGYVLFNEDIVTDNHNPKTFASTVINAVSDPKTLQSLKTSSELNALRFDEAVWTKKLADFGEMILYSE